jgi:poly-gamma-glutamate synthesis protein (capsule biosynthesis protein)
MCLLRINKTIRLSSVGNIIIHRSLIKSAKEGSNYDFNPCFQYIKNELHKADIAIGTFEGVLGESDFSGYPCFNAPNEILDALKNAGLNIINFASNHILDRGSTGILRTLKIGKSKNIDISGIRSAVTEEPYLIKEVKGHKIGFIFYTYETEKQGIQRTVNNIPFPKESERLVNTFNYNELEYFCNAIKKNIIEMRVKNVEFVIAGIHWGEEYITTENELQKTIARELNEIGVDIIIGSHPHVVQPYEVIKNSKGKETFVVYSQGNFISAQNYEGLSGNPDIPDAHYTEDGFVINFTIEEDNKGKLFLKKYDILPTWVYWEPKKLSIYAKVLHMCISAIKICLGRKPEEIYIHRVMPLPLLVENDFSNEMWAKVRASQARTESIIGNMERNLG